MKPKSAVYKMTQFWEETIMRNARQMIIIVMGNQQKETMKQKKEKTTTNWRHMMTLFNWERRFVEK